MNRLALRTRLTIWYTALLAAGLILFSGTLWLGLRSLLHADQRKNIEMQAQAFARYLRIEDSGRLADLKNEVDEYARSLGSGYAITVVDPQQNVFYQSASHHRHKMLATTLNVQLRRGGFRVQFAQSIQTTERALALLWWLLAGTIPCFVFASAAVGYWLSRRALKPVDRITDRALSIGVANLSERLPLPHTGDELERLTEAWNGMLGRLEASVNQITNFTADASHELRTPVAIIRLAAENALHKIRSPEEYRVALIRIQQESEGMTQLIEDLLLLARGDAMSQIPNAPDATHLDLVAVTAPVCASLQHVAAARGLTLTFLHANPTVYVEAEAAAVRRILLILLDNALKYTPRGGQVHVRISSEDDRIALLVEDDGPGIPDEVRPHVFERFFRADPARHRENGGYGLGLAIARTLARQQQASLDLQHSPTGGCMFALKFLLSTQSLIIS